MVRVVERPGHHPAPRAPGRRELPLLALVAALAVVAACGPRDRATEVLIVLVAPVSGGDAPAGTAFVRGCERAVAERNAAGGVRVHTGGAGLPVRLEVRDDRSETPLAEQILEETANGAAALVLATPNGVRAIAQAVVAERVELPLVVHPATSPGVPGAHMRWVFALPREAPAPPGPAPPTEADLEGRGHATVSRVLAALEGAGALDRITVRAALQSAR